MSIFDKIEDALFNIHWYFTVERQMNKGLKRFNKYMDEAIETLQRAANKENEYTDVITEIEEEEIEPDNIRDCELIGTDVSVQTEENIGDNTDIEHSMVS